jgi:nitroimidazol reductase NimA-like FMN-containing flavoprotein (pyridoxamine 5'-phosphate oxidase superfamily)
VTAKHDAAHSATAHGSGGTRPGFADPGDLAARVGQRRKELKLTRQEVAARAGMSLPYLDYLESHPATPTGAALRQLADALQTTPEALLGADGRRHPGPGPGSEPPSLQTIDPAECYELLAAGGVGRVVFSTADGPVVLPVNFGMAGHTVVLRTGADTELAARLDCQVAFEVDRVDEALSRGWSVLLAGHATRVTKEEQVRRIEAHTHVQPWAGGARDVYVQIHPHRVSGRRIGS